MKQSARIRLTGTNTEKIKDVCDEISQVAERTEVEMRGPVPLPTKRLEVPVRKSPDGEGTATWEHWEMRIHKRLIDIESDERALRQLMRLQVPEGVHIELVIEN
ncbi:30S ribosomal protein S10 [Methanonatronarchaeum sp. AMET6-2]|uniref:30S ribosomal protein S10 n=1 Tax=Methanonatronarchaeum sp. AMET6-2 TaxID=2933293 RepID=UPI0011F4BBAC|nr:30S ribosomal protein S10 [Methanonatronarchaeum sp. AMET6-2]RZN60973.1 MAG: 30S ribosomal protein S10 [Methanonatronarchaeia archaeon]UOY10666.1 30S ribosomal protein S10 [Methanonatronarchaeum sp. AMET6-2]